MFSKSQEKFQQYALRKVTIGVASCIIGCAMVGGASMMTTVVYGETTVEAVARDGAYEISDLITRLPQSNLKGKYHFKKIEMSEIARVQEELKKEKETINISKMLGPTSVATDVSVSRLKETLQAKLEGAYEEYALIMLDSEHSSYLAGGNILYLVKKNAEIINTETDYNHLIAKLLRNKDIQTHEIHSSVDFDKLPINILLDANGFGLAGYRRFIGINGIDLHSGDLRRATSGEAVNASEPSQLNLTLEAYTEHDQEILKLIEESTALKETSDAKRVEVWARFIRNKFKYDQYALAKKGQHYNEASSIVSAVKRGEAMCVGFSTLSARAYNMMGIRAYVVHGNTHGGAPHAVTRVYFDGHWHFVDTTASFGITSSYLIDQYSATQNFALAGEMVTHPSFENWMVKQRTRDLLLIHRDATRIVPNSSVDRYATPEEKKQLLARIDRLAEYCRYLIEKLKNSSLNNKENGIQSCEGTITDLNQYRGQIQQDEVVVKSYLETFDNRLRGLEGTASSVEFGFFGSNDPKFLTQTTTSSSQVSSQKPTTQSKTPSTTTSNNTTSPQTPTTQSKTLSTTTGNSTTSPQTQTTQPQPPSTTTSNSFTSSQKPTTQLQNNPLEILKSEYNALYSRYEEMAEGPEKEQLAKQILALGRRIEELGGKVTQIKPTEKPVNQVTTAPEEDKNSGAEEGGNPVVPQKGEKVEIIEEEIPVIKKEEWKAELWEDETEVVEGQAGRKQIIRTWKTTNGQPVGHPTEVTTILQEMIPTIVFKGTKPLKSENVVVTEVEIPITDQYLEDSQLDNGKTRIEEGRIGRKKVISTQPTERGMAVGNAVIREEVLQEMMPRKIYKGIKKVTPITTVQTSKKSTTTQVKQPKSDQKVIQSNLKAVYRLYHSGLKVHLYTADANEQQVLRTRGWKAEGVSWKTETKNGDPVYRLYHPNLKYHFYTRDANEYKELGQRGWKQEGIAYRSYGSVPIYRLYHRGIKKHLYTRDINERNVLAKRGWKYEGVAWYSQP